MNGCETMKEPNEEKIRELLKRAMPPVADPELKRDLWPQMLRRLAERATRVPWFDWVLVALLLVWLLLFPGVIPGLLYDL